MLNSIPEAFTVAPISPVVLVFSAINQASPVIKNLITGLKENVGVVGALSLAYNETQQAREQRDFVRSAKKGAIAKTCISV
ncbi:hypothetical protein A6S26_34635 [Nostoc sp. ATCC 43529]|nr:hypothetical protein A6S26_34635 [Nostoc sp. ATCC 43529]